jgi:hypothetical protein
MSRSVESSRTFCSPALVRVVVVSLLAIGECGCQDTAALEQSQAQVRSLEVSLQEQRETNSALQKSMDALAKSMTELQASVNAKQAEARTTTFKVESPQVKFEPKIVRSVAPPKRSADVIIESVSVASRKKNGNAWDEGEGSPDLIVYVSNLETGASDSTSKASDTYSTTYQQKTVRVSEGDMLRIVVEDKDLFADDTIGTYEKLITADTLNQRHVEWSFDQVQSLRVEFQP